MNQDSPTPSSREDAHASNGLDDAKILKFSLVFSLILGITTTVATVLINDPGWERLQLISLINFLLSFALWILWLRGYYQWTRYGFVLGYGTVVVYAAVIGIGVHGTAYAAFGIIVMLGALFIHRRAAYWIAGIATLFGLGLVWAFQTGQLPNADNPMAQMAVWANVSIYFFITAVILDIALRQVESALTKQKRAEEDLRQLNAELETHVANRTAQLAESESRYRLIAENASDVIWTTDLNLRITYISPSAERVRGYPVAEMIAQPITEILTPFSYQKAMSIFSEEVSKGTIQTDPAYYRLIDLEFTRRDGTAYWSEVKVSVLRDEAGQPIGLLGVGRDIDERRKAEAALRESEERYRLISKLSSDYAFSSVVHPDSVAEIDWIMGAFESISGYSMEELKAQGGWRSIIHPDSLAEDDKVLAALFANQPTDAELQIIAKNGDQRWVHFYAYPVWDEEQNRLVAIHGAGKDITQQKQAEAREKRQRRMLEKVIELGQTVTQQSSLESCLAKIHHSIKHELGFDRVGLLLYDPTTNELQDALTPNQTSDIDDSSWYLRSIAEHRNWNAVMKTPKGLVLLEEVPSHAPKPDEKTRPMRQHATLAAWAGDKPIALIAVDNGLTRHPLTEDKLEALKLFAGYAGLAIENARWNAELEERVVERTAELEAANRELQDFTYTIAHDLRAPARAMIGFSRLLQADHFEQLNEDGQHYLNRVNYGAQRMGQMIDELLAFTRLGRQTLRKAPVNMHVLVRQVWEEFEPERVERTVKVHIGSLPDAEADQDLIEQVWRHLISNAIKFTRKIPEAMIIIGTTEKKGVYSYFIRDNGVGFDMQYANKLFGVFHRLHLEEEYEGTGMGLATAHRIITRHGGRIWVESEVDKGATFYFTLPHK